MAMFGYDYLYSFFVNPHSTSKVADEAVLNKVHKQSSNWLKNTLRL
jgi:hypothetical protein